MNASVFPFFKHAVPNLRKFRMVFHVQPDFFGGFRKCKTQSLTQKTFVQIHFKNGQQSKWWRTGLISGR
jgi:hypothetical protein